MKFLTPQFWQHRKLLVYLLYPFSWIYLCCHLLKRLLLKTHVSKVSVPVICVGNLTVGGTGKTPVALALASYFDKPAFLTRGYGGLNNNCKAVNVDYHTAQHVGDEALILARTSPTWVGKNRYHSALQAIEQGAEILIMDDGLQHLSLYQNCRFVVVDGEYGFGNEFVLPAGPLRENITYGFNNADAVIIIGDDQHQIEQRFCRDIPVFKASLEAVQHDLNNLKGKKIIAFAGIGRPQKFFQFLKSCGCKLIDRHSFPDHHVYRTSQLMALQYQSSVHNAVLVTTEKDYVRLPDQFKSSVTVCRVNLQFQQPNKLKKFLYQKLAN